MERRDFLKVITVGTGATFLNACAPEVAKKIATLTPTEAKPTPSQQPDTPKPEAVTRLTQDEIATNAEKNFREFDYLKSPQYLENLKERESRGEFPKIPNGVLYIKPNTIDYVFDAPSDIFGSYGRKIAYTISDASKWTNPQKRPWLLVDAGITKIGEANIVFYTIEYENPDKTTAYWGYFHPVSEKSNVSVAQLIKSGSAKFSPGYPTPNMVASEKACASFLSQYTDANLNLFCQIIGNNPETSIPKADIRNWSKTGILKLTSNSVPWSLAATASL